MHVAKSTPSRGMPASAGVDDDHVRHRHERSWPAKKFAAEGGPVFFKLKLTLQQSDFSRKVRATIGP
jgi:hypothetical protein